MSRIILTIRGYRTLFQRSSRSTARGAGERVRYDDRRMRGIDRKKTIRTAIRPCIPLPLHHDPITCRNSKRRASAVENTKGADVLLQAALPNPSPAQRRQALMEETALPAGYPLSGETEDQQFWQRLIRPLLTRWREKR